MAKVVKRRVEVVVEDPDDDVMPVSSSGTALNDQVTDSVTQVNTKVLGDAPAIAMGNLYQSDAQALGLAALNATNAQQQNNITTQSSTSMGLSTIYTIDTATGVTGTSDIVKLVPKK